MRITFLHKQKPDIADEITVADTLELTNPVNITSRIVELGKDNYAISFLFNHITNSDTFNTAVSFQVEGSSFDKVFASVEKVRDTIGDRLENSLLDYHKLIFDFREPNQLTIKG